MSANLVGKYRQQIARILERASDELSYNGCNDLPKDFWDNLTPEDREEMRQEAYMEGIIDKEGDIDDSTAASLFAKWLSE